MEDVGADRVGQGAGQGEFVVGEFLVELMEGAAAKVMVGLDQEGAEAALAQLDLAAGAVRDQTELEVDIGQLGESVLVSGQWLRTHGEQAFLAFVERVRLEAAETFEHAAPGGECGGGGERGEFRIRDRHQLGAEERTLLHDVGVEILEAGFAFKEDGVRGIFTDPQAGVGAETFERLVDALFEFERSEEGGGGFGESSAELRDLRIALLERGKFGLPGGVIGIDTREIPAVGLGDFLAGGDAGDGGGFGGTEQHGGGYWAGQNSEQLKTMR